MEIDLFQLALLVALIALKKPLGIEALANYVNSRPLIRSLPWNKQ